MDGKALQCEPGQSMYFNGFECGANVSLKFYQKELMDIIFKGSWPDIIKFDVIAIEKYEKTIPRNIRWLDGLQGVQANTIMAGFVHYFANIESFIENKYSKDRWKWPETLSFGRTVRNAFAHGGKINIENLKTKNFSWKKLSYGPKDNGKLIIFNDITLVEIVYLAIEMESLL